jgi:hypothetical protein
LCTLTFTFLDRGREDKTAQVHDRTHLQNLYTRFAVNPFVKSLYVLDPR